MDFSGSADFLSERQVQPPGNPVSCACSTESLREYHGRGKGNGACTPPSLFLRAVKAALCGAGAYRLYPPARQPVLRPL